MEKKSKGKVEENGRGLSVNFYSIRRSKSGGATLFHCVEELCEKYGYSKVDFVSEMLVAGILSSKTFRDDFEKMIKTQRVADGSECNPAFGLLVDRVRSMMIVK